MFKNKKRDSLKQHIPQLAQKTIFWFVGDLSSRVIEGCDPFKRKLLETLSSYDVNSEPKNLLEKQK